MTEQPDGSGPTNVAQAALRAVERLPRDQALGLRLLAMARAASACHMAKAADAGTDLRASQAADLVACAEARR